MRQEWGVSTVIMNKRGNPCPKCLPWVGKVLIDDVWSGGSRKELKQIEKDNRKEAQKQYGERQRDKFGRLIRWTRRAKDGTSPGKMPGNRKRQLKTAAEML